MTMTNDGRPDGVAVAVAAPYEQDGPGVIARTSAGPPDPGEPPRRPRRLSSRPPMTRRVRPSGSSFSSKPRSSSVASQRSMIREDFERRVLTGDREDLRVAGVGSDPVEEHAHLELP